jgi:hypothetical protein
MLSYQLLIIINMLFNKIKINKEINIFNNNRIMNIFFVISFPTLSRKSFVELRMFSLKKFIGFLAIVLRLWVNFISKNFFGDTLNRTLFNKIKD